MSQVWSRIAAGIAAIVVIALSTASSSRAQSSQVLLQETFAAPTTSSQVLTLNTAAPGFPCLTANPSGAPAGSTIANCNLATPDAAGQGMLRFTAAVEQQASGFVAATSLPTSQGLQISFKQYQYGGYGLDGPGSAGGGDGIAFFLAVAPPTPQTLGPQGGALGYASAGSSAGLPGGWLGIGIDAFGNFSNPGFGGAGCLQPAWAGFNPDSITVRGPGHATEGYCLLASSANGVSDALTDAPTSNIVSSLVDGQPLRGDDRASSERTITISITPSDGLFRVYVNDGSGQTLATSGALPTSYYDPETGALVNGLPPRITFGFSASTGSATDIHEISNLSASTVEGGVPVLQLAKTNTTDGTPSPGDGFDYVITAGVGGSVSETDPQSIRVADTLPAGVTLNGSVGGSGWVCTPESASAFECAYGNPSAIAPGTSLPTITVPVLLSSSAAAGTTLINTATVISSDAAQPVQASSSITVSSPAPPISITTTSVPNGTINTAYPGATLAATGGSGTRTWNVSAGALPNGMALSAAGALGGTPTQSGTFTFTARVVDTGGSSATRAFTFTIAPAASPLTITTTSVPNGTINTAYPGTTLAATGGSGTRTWNVSAGALPNGMALSAAGALGGTPTQSGTFTFTARVVDTGGSSATRAFTFTIAPATSPLTITTTSLAGGQVNVAYSATLQATGGVAPRTWSLSAGALPTGLSLSGAGAITGTPTQAQTATFTARVADAAGTAVTRVFTITVTRLTITTTTVAAGQIQQPYSVQLAATGGTGALRWTVFSGVLPQGLSLSTSGLLAGTPTQVVTERVVVRVTDAAGAIDGQAYNIRINPLPLTVTTAALATGEVGVAYAATLAATGGVGPYTWSLPSGPLPTGLVLSPQGVIAGTPTQSGTFAFWVRVTDDDGRTNSRRLTVQFVPALAVTTTTLDNGTVTRPYSAALASSGGFGTPAWSRASGTLPTGLSLSAGGVISGTPTVVGTFNFTVQAVDSLGGVASRALRIVITTARVEKAYVLSTQSNCRVAGTACASEIVSVDLESQTIVARIPVANEYMTAGEAIVASPDGNRVYVTLRSSTSNVSTLRAIDTQTDTIVQSATGVRTLWGVSSDNRWTYVTTDSALQVRDAQTLAVRAEYALDLRQVTGIVAAPAANRIYVALYDYQAGRPITQLLTLNATTLGVVRTLNLGGIGVEDLAITPSGARVLLSFGRFFTNEFGIMEIDTATNVPVNTIPLVNRTYPRPIEAPDETRVFGLTLYNELAEYSLVTDAQVRILGNAFSLALDLSSDRTSAYVLGPSLNSLLRADLSSGNMTTVVTLGTPGQMSLLPLRLTIARGR